MEKLSSDNNESSDNDMLGKSLSMKFFSHLRDSKNTEISASVSESNMAEKVRLMIGLTFSV